jgi:hypothetical protein
MTRRNCSIPCGACMESIEAIPAGCAIPLAFPPVRIANDYLVDRAIECESSSGRYFDVCFLRSATFAAVTPEGIDPKRAVT